MARTQLTTAEPQTVDTFMRAVEQSRAARGLSKADLARRSHLPSPTVRKLLTATDGNPTLETVLGLLRPLGLRLALEPAPESVADASANPEQAREDVRVWLAHYGAPLYGTSEARKTKSIPRPELVLALALALARQDAAVARALPLVLWKTRKHLDMSVLRRFATERGQERTLGFFLELTAHIAGDEALARAARPLGPPKHRKNASQFFPVRSRLERRLAEEKTPAVARRWGFRMNMGLDSFEGMFRKAKAVT